MNSQCINSKVDFRENDVTTDEEAHFITTKGSIYQEDQNFQVFMHLIKEFLKSIKYNLLELQIEIIVISTMIIRDFYIPVPIIDRISRD